MLTPVVAKKLHGEIVQIPYHVRMFQYATFLFTVLSIHALTDANTGPFFHAGQDPAPDAGRWERVEMMSDEFEGDCLDHAKWQDQPEGYGWGWIGRPPGLFRPENVQVKDGMMQVTVGVLDHLTIINGNEFKYQGAIVRSLHAGQPGWYYECRMKANATEMSSTFWLMTKSDGIKKLETDIQECVGRTSEATEAWGKEWDHIFHSNAIHRTNAYNPNQVQLQGMLNLEERNCDRFYVYGAWWKSEDEIQFFLDGKYAYSIFPSIEWDVPAYIQMAIETYSWNPVPEDGGMIASGSVEERTTLYDWVRVWKLE